MFTDDYIDYIDNLINNYYDGTTCDDYNYRRPNDNNVYDYLNNHNDDGAANDDYDYRAFGNFLRKFRQP